MIGCTFENGNKTNTLRHVTVDCIITKGDTILLAKRAPGLLEAGKWCMPGGYLNRDESTEAGMLREVMEETGCTLRNVHLLRINDLPARPKLNERGNVRFIFFAEVDTETDQHDHETAELQWFPLNDLPNEDDVAFDHFEDITAYKRYLAEHTPLPIIGTI